MSNDNTKMNLPIEHKTNNTEQTSTSMPLPLIDEYFHSPTSRTNEFAI